MMQEPKMDSFDTNSPTPHYRHRCSLCTSVIARTASGNCTAVGIGIGGAGFANRLQVPANKTMANYLQSPITNLLVTVVPGTPDLRGAMPKVSNVRKAASHTPGSGQSISAALSHYTVTTAAQLDMGNLGGWNIACLLAVACHLLKVL